MFKPWTDRTTLCAAQAATSAGAYFRHDRERDHRVKGLAIQQPELNLKIQRGHTDSPQTGRTRHPGAAAATDAAGWKVERLAWRRPDANEERWR